MKARWQPRASGAAPVSHRPPDPESSMTVLVTGCPTHRPGDRLASCWPRLAFSSMAAPWRAPRRCGAAGAQAALLVPGPVPGLAGDSVPACPMSCSSPCPGGMRRADQAGPRTRTSPPGRSCPGRFSTTTSCWTRQTASPSPRRHAAQCLRWLLCTSLRTCCVTSSPQSGSRQGRDSRIPVSSPRSCGAATMGGAVDGHFRFSGHSAGDDEPPITGDKR